MNLPKFKKILLLFSLFAFALLAAKTASAFYSTKTGEPYQEIFSQEVYGKPSEINQPSFTNETMLAVIASLNDKLLGCIGEDCPETLGAQSQGAAGAMANLITTIYENPPASTGKYLAYLGSNLGLVKPVYAQGLGFQGLRPILEIWTAFRNIAYLFFALVFVVIGFAIMFRVKIDPQTVVSIQNALPRVIVALILVTFSYAIAGLVIDLIYVAIGLIAAVFSSTGLIERSEQLAPQYLNASIWTAAGAIFRGGFQAVFGLVRSMVAPSLVTGGVAAIIGTIVGGVIGGFTALPLVLGGVAAVPVLLLVFTLILLWTLLRLFLTLLRAYISIILAVIFGPLQIMLGAIPGVPGFGGWLKNLIANAAVFPAVAAMLMLAAIIGHRTGAPGWSPPFLKVGETAEGMRNLIALGILLATPSVADMIREALQVKPFPYGAAIGQAFGPARFGARVGIPAGMQTLYERRLLLGETESARGIAARVMEMLGWARRPPPR